MTRRMANAPSYYIGGHSIQTVGLVFSVDVDFSDLLVIIRGEDVGLDLSVDVDFSDLFIIIHG